jgi:hypothetical protein
MRDEFFDEISDDEPTREELETKQALIDIALVKAYNYCQEYNEVSGQAQEKQGARLLKEGYVDGFLAGVVFRMSGGHEG